MRRVSRPRAAVGLLAMAAAACLPIRLAAGPRLADFAVDRASGWAEALALCDLSRFLLARPDLDAEVIANRDEASGELRPLYAPEFMPADLFQDADVRRAYYRLERAGDVNRKAALAARRRLAASMLRSYRRATWSERRALEAQGRACDALLARPPAS